MSSFSTLNTALTALNAQRQALDIAGQNLANVNTPGYTRQRVMLTSLASSSPATLGSGATLTSGGVRATAIERLGDSFLEMRVRQTTSAAASLAQVGAAWTQVEATLTEPGEAGLSATLDTFFAGWQDIANNPTNEAVRSTLLEKATTLVGALAESYGAIRTQWETARAQVDAAATSVNTAAAAVADLNEQILSITASGGSANELIDQRASLLTTLSGLVGAEAASRADGSVDVMVGGNALVRGSVASPVEVAGSTDFTDLSDPVRLVWSADSSRTVSVSGGTLDGLFHVLSADGPLAGLAATYNGLAADLASDVPGSINALHASARTSAGAAGGAFFALAPSDPSAPSAPAVLRLQVVPTSGSDIAVAAPGKGDGDASIADQISQITTTTTAWSSAVATIGVRSARAQALAASSDTSRASATQQLLAATSVDESEETMNLIAYQRAFQSAARLTSVVDELLDTLINRMAR